MSQKKLAGIMAAVSLVCNTNMAAVTSCENALYANQFIDRPHFYPGDCVRDRRLSFYRDMDARQVMRIKPLKK